MGESDPNPPGCGCPYGRFGNHAPECPAHVNNLTRGLAEKLESASDAEDPRAALAAVIKPLRDEHETHRERLDPTCPFCTGDIT